MNENNEADKSCVQCRPKNRKQHPGIDRMTHQVIGSGGHRAEGTNGWVRKRYHLTADLKDMAHRGHSNGQDYYNGSNDPYSNSTPPRACWGYVFLDLGGRDQPVDNNGNPACGYNTSIDHPTNIAEASRDVKKTAGRACSGIWLEAYYLGCIAENLGLSDGAMA